MKPPEPSFRECWKEPSHHFPKEKSFPHWLQISLVFGQRERSSLPGVNILGRRCQGSTAGLPRTEGAEGGGLGAEPGAAVLPADLPLPRPTPGEQSQGCLLPSKLPSPSWAPCIPVSICQTVKWTAETSQLDKKKYCMLVWWLFFFKKKKILPLPSLLLWLCFWHAFIHKTRHWGFSNSSPTLKP